MMDTQSCHIIWWGGGGGIIMPLGGGGGTGLNIGGIPGPPDRGGGGSMCEWGPGRMRGWGPGPPGMPGIPPGMPPGIPGMPPGMGWPPIPSFSSLNANWRKNCLVSLFQCVQNFSLSTSRLGTWACTWGSQRVLLIRNEKRKKKQKTFSKKVYLERDRFIRLCSKQKILPLPVWRLNFLFIGWHETVPWSHSFSNFWTKAKKLVTLCICIN